MSMEIRTIDDVAKNVEEKVHGAVQNAKIDTKDEIIQFTKDAPNYGFDEYAVEKYFNDRNIDVKSIMGADFSFAAPVEETTVKEVKRPVVTPVAVSGDDKEYIEKTVAKRVKELSRAGKSGQEIADILDKEFIKENFNAAKYVTTVHNVTKLFDMVVKAGGEHIDELKKAIKAKQFEGIEWNSSTKSIVKSLETTAEVERILSKKDVYKAYDDALGERDEKGLLKGVPEFEKAYNAAKAKFENSNDKDTKNALKVLKRQSLNEAIAYVQNNWMADTKGASHRAIAKELRAKNVNNDKFIDKAIDALKADRKALAPEHAVANRLEELKAMGSSLTDEYMAKGLKRVTARSGRKLEEKLMDPKGIHKGNQYEMADGTIYRTGFRNEDGTLNIEKLATGILKRVGNGVLDRNDDDYGESELKAVHDYLKFETGEDFSKNEIKRIVKFFKVKYQQKDRRFMTILNSMLLGLPGLVASTAAGAIAGASAIAKNSAVQLVDLNIHLGSMSVNEALGTAIGDLKASGAKEGFTPDISKLVEKLTSEELTKEQAKAVSEELKTLVLNEIQNIKNGKGDMNTLFNIVDNGDGTVRLQLLQAAQHNNRLKNMLIGTLAGVLPGLAEMLARGIFTAAFGKSRNEKTCISPSDYDITDKIYTDPELYKQYIKTNNPASKAAWMMKKVDECVEITKDDNQIAWHELYQQTLRRQGGFNSTINPDECKTIKYANPEDIYKEIIKDKPQPVPPCPDCDDIWAEEDVATEKYIAPHAWDRKGGERWEAIVRAKYPCLVEDCHGDIYGKNGAIKIMQRALCTDRNGKFDRVKFNAIISGDIPKHIDFPDEIEYIYAGKPGTCKYTDNEVARVSQKQLGKGSRSNNDRYGDGRNKSGSEHFFIYSTTCDENRKGKGRTREEAKANYENQ